MTIELLVRSALLGAGLAMDAFSVSLADGLGEPDMNRRRALAIAGTFAVFQFVMPVTGWVLVRTAVDVFGWLERFIPWIALALLLYIGGRMLTEGVRERRVRRAAGTQDCDIAAARGTLSDEADADRTGLSGETDISRVRLSGEKDAARSRISGGDLFMQGVATSIDALSVGFTIESYSLSAALVSSAVIGIVTLVICMEGLRLGRKAGIRLSGRAEILGGIILILIGIEIWVRGIM